VKRLIRGDSERIAGAEQKLLSHFFSSARYLDGVSLGFSPDVTQPPDGMDFASVITGGNKHDHHEEGDGYDRGSGVYLDAWRVCQLRPAATQSESSSGAWYPR
jgi:hypothetical protein